MPQTSQLPPETKSRKTTISMPAVLEKWAEEIVQKDGYPSFSALVQDLLRQKHKAQQMQRQ